MEWEPDNKQPITIATFSLVCGVQCSGHSNALNARRYAEQHQVSAVDSCTRALSLD